MFMLQYLGNASWKKKEILNSNRGLLQHCYTEIAGELLNTHYRQHSENV